MSKDAYATKLAWFKQNEKPEAVLLVADSPELIRIAVAWTNTSVKREPHSVLRRGRTESETWHRLWKSARYAREELIEKSCVPARTFDRKFAALVGNRVLYPDGTVNSFVRRYLRKRVAALFEAGPKRARKKH